MLTEEFAEVVKTISRITEKIQTVTEKQREASKKIQLNSTMHALSTDDYMPESIKNQNQSK